MIMITWLHSLLDRRKLLSVDAYYSGQVISVDEFKHQKACVPDRSVTDRGSTLLNVTNLYGQFSSHRISEFLLHPRWKYNGGDYWMAHTFRLQILNNSLYLSHLPGNAGEERRKMHPRMYHIICFLQQLLRKVSVSDSDFLIYIGDLFDWDMLPFYDPELRYPIPLFVQEKTI